MGIRPSSATFLIVCVIDCVGEELEELSRNTECERLCDKEEINELHLLILLQVLLHHFIQLIDGFGECEHLLFVHVEYGDVGDDQWILRTELY